MKKIIIFILMLCMLSGCGVQPKGEYFGAYEKDSLYQSLKVIEDCTNPDELEIILEKIYGENLSYIKLEYDTEAEAFKPPYEEMFFNVHTICAESKNKGALKTDVYAFFRDYKERPSFIMDSDGSYLVELYTVESGTKTTYKHTVDAWVTTDLYLAQNGYAYCNGDEEKRKELAKKVEEIGPYLHLMKLIGKKEG